MKKNLAIEQPQPFAETYLATAGFPLPKSFDTNSEYLRAIESWVRNATSILADAKEQKRSIENSGA
ncbi:MAG: hypothetical protein ACXADX_05145 [Candidatus Hodarchaeales archaeon]|jgi:hypothetical protein